MFWPSVYCGIYHSEYGQNRSCLGSITAALTKVTCPVLTSFLLCASFMLSFVFLTLFVLSPIKTIRQAM